MNAKLSLSAFAISVLVLSSLLLVLAPSVSAGKLFASAATCGGYDVPREYNECFDCYVSRHVRQNADCSFDVLVSEQYDGACDGWCSPEPIPSPQCGGYDVPREYNECFDCYVSRHVRQNADCSFDVLVSEQYDGACGG